MKKHGKLRESSEGDRSFNEKRLCENLSEKFKAHQVPFGGMIDVNLLVLKMFPSASDFTSAARSTLVLRRRMPGDVKIHGPSFHHGPYRGLDTSEKHRRTLVGATVQHLRSQLLHRLKRGMPRCKESATAMYRDAPRCTESPTILPAPQKPKFLMGFDTCAECGLHWLQKIRKCIWKHKQHKTRTYKNI